MNTFTKNCWLRKFLAHAQALHMTAREERNLELLLVRGISPFNPDYYINNFLDLFRRLTER